MERVAKAVVNLPPLFAFHPKSDWLLWNPHLVLVEFIIPAQGVKGGEGGSGEGGGREGGGRGEGEGRRREEGGTMGFWCKSLRVSKPPHASKNMVP